MIKLDAETTGEAEEKKEEDQDEGEKKIRQGKDKMSPLKRMATKPPPAGTSISHLAKATRLGESLRAKVAMESKCKPQSNSSVALRSILDYKVQLSLTPPPEVNSSDINDFDDEIEGTLCCPSHSLTLGDSPLIQLDSEGEEFSMQTSGRRPEQCGKGSSSTAARHTHKRQRRDKDV